MARRPNEDYSSQREKALKRLFGRSAKLRWSPRLLQVLLEELRVDDSFEQLVGDVRRISMRRYPQVLAIAILVAHSWRPNDLIITARRLGLATKVSLPANIGRSSKNQAHSRVGVRTDAPRRRASRPTSSRRDV